MSPSNLPIFTDTKLECNVRLSGISLIQLRLLLNDMNILVAHVNIALLEMIYWESRFMRCMEGGGNMNVLTFLVLIQATMTVYFSRYLL